MTPDPTLQQRYADILAEPANADLTPMVQALDAHFAVTALPPTLSHAPMPAEQGIFSLAPKTTLHIIKGSIPMENQITTLEPRRRDKMKDCAPTTNRSQRRAYPLLAAAVLVLVIGAFFGVQLLHQHETGTNTPGSGVPIGKTPTPAAAQYLRLDKNSAPVITRISAAPFLVADIGGSYSDNVVSASLYIISAQAKVGDIVTAVWEIAGITPQPLSNGDKCCQWTIDQHDLATYNIFFSVGLTKPGKGSVKISYNGTLAYTVTFTIAAYSTALPTPAPSTPCPTHHLRSSCTNG